MITSPLLSNVRHRAMVAPVSPPSTRLIHISPGCWIILIRLKFFSKWELSMGLDFKSNVLYKSIALKNIQSNMNYVLKNT